MCEITEKILTEYDKRIVHFLQLAYDIFDPADKNVIPAVELERTLRSVGYTLTYQEIEMLLTAIDPRNTGFLEFNDFMSQVVPFLRAKYGKAADLSMKHLETVFAKFDSTGDGLLQPYELKHILRMTARRVTQEEIDALVEYLDVDGDGDISWDEFARLCEVVNNDEEMAALSYNLRSALRKIQYSALPDPEELLTMFIGLPNNFRVSALSDIEHENTRNRKNPHSLQHVVCHNPEVADIPSDSVMQFEVQMVRVSGVPSEDPVRSDDLISRGVKFAICQTDRPPSAGTPGNPPRLLGNVTKLRATAHPKFLDKWSFNNPEVMDPDKSCFVRCSTTQPYRGDQSKGQIREPDAKTTPMDQLYLFIELYATFRVSDKFEITPGGIKKAKRKVVVVEEEMQLAPSAGQLTAQVKKKKEDSEYLVPTREVNANTKSRMGGFLGRKGGADEHHTEKAVNQDPTGVIGAGKAARNFIKAQFFSKDKSKAARAEDKRLRRSRGEGSDEEGSQSGSENGEGPEDGNGKKAPKMFDMCCGWAMVPIAATLRGTARKFKVNMCGGTPFAMVDIREEDVALRQGAFQTLRRMFGFNVQSVLEILITPSVPAPRFVPRPISTSASHSNLGNVSNTAASFNGSMKDSVDANGTPADVAWFTRLLPPNIVIPTSSVTVVGMYRKLLIKSLQLSHHSMERVLPQTGVLHHADALLSSFPRILADDAACRVLLLLWKREFPKDLNGKTYKDMTVSDTSNIRALQVFRSVVLRLWRAFGSPHALPDKLTLFETDIETLQREMRIREMVAIPVDGAAAAAEAAKNTMTAKTIAAAANARPPNVTKAVSSISAFADTSKAPPKQAPGEATIVGGVVINDPGAYTVPKSLVEENKDKNTKKADAKAEAVEQPLCTPFNARELMWTGRVV
jgi:Ca2+-binding EF-hand superfamily protein